MKRKIDVKRELLEEWLLILDEMVEAGGYLAILETCDSKQDIIKFKRKYLSIKNKIITFTRDKIETIRIEMDKYK